MATKLSDALQARNPVQDSNAGDDPVSMGMSAVQYAIFVAIALVGVAGGKWLFSQGKSVTGTEQLEGAIPEV